ncbi:hypothetical protein COW36_03005 [bacterium (Candidatus Blackallbacteria) CG17_big_fil_post_rev_8_21_14_2_50_48_46]|uniref:protein O-GlcNAc transferase n=1 Tax=bacterium (Candidatus Blackallbacteria) CG17_big_fil_post_rev_8_21_14_2_50_48_46 TaxID=2014261 RepID=A0A2M7GAD6_9BACT|nr:MAG: hypothetical protein COW64_12470 [bacterium (Candidatus Blackallbacteria) CG18_big_fil_WC_8_21_14_2_50_49_26]PIW19096.1 MAG: hypothetical protein COW36_03005 [bacterium (Candidatus Blackallbacteria) CG17_big_fil_post_rev_8_21_14_2_50_48_46]PIW44537.1 MAG: hypothetical protein COW20_23115 [bacterium (Candidatus Blackallbacteria) CG13_big_fil_rev_8_21_14_2_50_49_14]
MVKSDALKSLDLYTQGMAAFKAHQHGQAVALVRQALDYTLPPPQRTMITHMLGILLCYISEYAEARQCFEACLAQEPNHLQAMFYLGSLERLAGNLEQARTLYTQILLYQGTESAYLYALANTLHEQGHLDEAEAYYRQVLAHAPENSHAHFFLSVLLKKAEQNEQAQYHYLKACELNLCFLTYSSDKRAYLPVVEGRLEQIATLGSEGFTLFEELLIGLYHVPTFPLTEHASLIHTWGEALRPPLDPGPRPPRKKLRIGYFSYKFCNFTSTPTLKAFLRQHDHEAFEICLLAEVEQEDSDTAEFRQMADRFANIHGQSDEAVCDLIRSWEIDILVDLGGHALKSRLPILAYRPAPIQVSTPLAFASSSGIADYYLVDAPLLLGEGAAMFNETLIPMKTALVWEPSLAQRPEPIKRLGEPLVFGFCNQAQKISLPLAQAWAAILKAVPDLTLRLKCPAFNDPSTHFYFKLLLEKAGVPLNQVKEEGFSVYEKHLEFFNGIDLLLDAFPFQGGVTTCDSLWMGVPVLSVVTPGRVGNCFLVQAGQQELLCADLEDYVAKAIELAQNPEQLRLRRSQVRLDFEASPLCQPAAFTRELEQIYRDLWAGKYPPK